MKTKQLLLLLPVFLFHLTSQGQELVASAGGSTSLGEVTVSWAAGEVVSETAEAGNIIITQGFFQDFFEISTIYESLVSDVRIDVYPNPTAQYLHIRKTENTEVLRYSLYDLHGKLYKTGEIQGGDHSFDLRSYAAGSFILRITTQQGQLLKTFQISKVN